MLRTIFQDKHIIILIPESEDVTDQYNLPSIAIVLHKQTIPICRSAENTPRLTPEYGIALLVCTRVNRFLLFSFLFSYLPLSAISWNGTTVTEHEQRTLLNNSLQI